MGQRYEDEHCLAEDFVAFVLGHELDGAAIMETVGELDKRYSYVVVEREENALEVLGLEGFCIDTARFAAVFVVEYGFDFGKAVYQRGDFLAEEVAKVVYCVFCIFHYIVEERSYDRFVAEAAAKASASLEGRTFVVSGTFSISRDDLKALIARHSGKCTGSVSGKTDYLLAGDKPGPDKIKKAAELGVAVINERDFYNMLPSSEGSAHKEEIVEELSLF